MSGLILPNGYQQSQPERRSVTTQGDQSRRQSQDSDSNPEIFPSERKKISATFLALQRKWMRKEGTDGNLLGFADHAENELAKLGFRVNVDISNIVSGPDGQQYISPIVDIVGRIKDEEFDHDQMTHEIQHGLDDGIVGKFGKDGKTLIDPTLKL